jgi:hypothetical protein
VPWGAEKLVLWSDAETRSVGLVGRRVASGESGRQELMDTVVSFRRQRERGGAAIGPVGNWAPRTSTTRRTFITSAGRYRDYGMAPQWLLRTPRTLTESRCPVLRRSDSGLWIPVGDEAA